MGGQILVGFIGPPRGSPELKKKSRLVPANLSKVGVLDFVQALKKYLGDPDGAKLLSGLPALPVTPPVDPIVPLVSDEGDSSSVDAQVGVLELKKSDNGSLQELPKSIKALTKLDDAVVMTPLETTLVSVGFVRAEAASFSQFLGSPLADPDREQISSKLSALPVSPSVAQIVPDEGSGSLDVRSEILQSTNSGGVVLQGIYKPAEAHATLPNAVVDAAWMRGGIRFEVLQGLLVSGGKDLSPKTLAAEDDIDGSVGVVTSHDQRQDKKEDQSVPPKLDGTRFSKIEESVFSKDMHVSDFYLDEHFASSKILGPVDFRVVNADGAIGVEKADGVEKPNAFRFPKGISDEIVMPVGVMTATCENVVGSRSEQVLPVFDPVDHGDSFDFKGIAVSKVSHDESGFWGTKLLRKTLRGEVALFPKLHDTEPGQVHLVAEIAKEDRADIRKRFKAFRLEMRASVAGKVSRQSGQCRKDSDVGLALQVRRKVPEKTFLKVSNSVHFKVGCAAYRVRSSADPQTKYDLKHTGGEKHRYVWVAMPESEKVVATIQDDAGNIRHLSLEHTSRRLVQVVLKWANASVQRVPASAEMEVKGIGLLKMSLSYDKHLGGLKLEIRIIQPSGDERIFTQFDLKAAEQMIREGLSRIGVLSVSVRLEGGAGNTWQQVSASSSGKGGIGDSLGQETGQSSYQMMREMVNLLAHLKRERKGE